MDGSPFVFSSQKTDTSAPRVYGWFLFNTHDAKAMVVCPACVWMVPNMGTYWVEPDSLPRVRMDGSESAEGSTSNHPSAPRAYGWFHIPKPAPTIQRICPASAWVVPVVSDRVLAPVFLLPPRCR